MAHSLTEKKIGDWGLKWYIHFFNLIGDWKNFLDFSSIVWLKKLPKNGDVVVAFIDDEEVTLKRFRKKGDSVALERANKNYKTHIYGPDRVKIQGVLTSLIRLY